MSCTSLWCLIYVQTHILDMPSSSQNKYVVLKMLLLFRCAKLSLCVDLQNICYCDTCDIINVNTRIVWMCVYMTIIIKEKKFIFKFRTWIIYCASVSEHRAIAWRSKSIIVTLVNKPIGREVWLRSFTVNSHIHIFLKVHVHFTVIYN